MAINSATLRKVGDQFGTHSPIYRYLLQLSNQVIAQGGGASSAGVFVFRPGVASSSNSYATENELFAAIGGVEAPIIACDFTNVPSPFLATRDWDVRGGQMIAVYKATGLTVLQFDEPFQLLNCASVRGGMAVNFNRTISRGWVNVDYTVPGGPPIYALIDGGCAYNIGPSPAVTTDIFTVVSVGGSSCMSPSGGGAAFVRGLPGASIFAVNLASSRSVGQGYGDNWVDGVGTLAYGIADASFQLPTTTFAGTVNPTNLIDLAESVSYTPAVPANWAAPPPTTVAEAIDRLVAAVGGTP